MRTQFYHNSKDIFDRPSYSKMAERFKDKRFCNRALGLFASTQRVGLEYYGEHQYRFQMAMNSAVIEVPAALINRNASHEYFRGLRRAYLSANIDAIKFKTAPSLADYILVVINFDSVEFWERARWENAFYQGMTAARREALLQASIAGDLEALLAAFCPRLAPMGSVFWEEAYQRLDDGQALGKQAVLALEDALRVSGDVG